MGIAKSDLCTLVNLCACILIPLCVQSHSWSPDNKVALFVFGDSLLDPGNNNYLKNTIIRANYYPYGETYFHHPTGRFTDGRIIPDFLVNTSIYFFISRFICCVENQTHNFLVPMSYKSIAEYAKLPLIPPYLQPGNHQFIYGSNFASAGAGALSETRPGMVVDLGTQLIYFKNVEKKLREKLGDAETKKLLSKAIYLFNVGGNDYRVRVTNSTVLQSSTNEEYVGMVIGNFTAVIKGIYKSGGRKFGFLNMPSLTRSPNARSVLPLATYSELSAVANLHNKAFSKAIKELKRQLLGFKYSIFDFNTTVDDLLKNPSKYGFKEAEVACCGSGKYRGVLNCGVGEYELCKNVKDYAFFDGGHLTEKAYSQIAKLMWSGSSDVVRPYNLQTLIKI